MKRIELKQLIKETVKSNLIEEAIQYNNLKNSIKNLIVEMLNEVDWEKFSDVSKVCLTPEQVVAKLNAELERLKIKTSKRPSADINFPRISKGNIPRDAASKINIEKFKREIMEIPETIFDEGIKSKHTSNEYNLTVNTGIPAFKGVLWDETNNVFFVISTCPGAGSCIIGCYATEGFYIMNDGKNMKLINRLQLMMNHPDMYENRAYNELELYAFKANRENKKLNIRWNDAGDIFSDVYFYIIVNVTKKLKEKYNVDSYFYTKSAKYIDLAKKHGLIANFSETGAATKEAEKLNLSVEKKEVTIPFTLFKDLFVIKISKKGLKTGHFLKDKYKRVSFKDDIQGRLELKRRVFNHYKDQKGFEDLTLDTLLYTDELPRNEEEPNKYKVIVLPSGDSDLPAQRKDVRITFLCYH